MGKTKEAERDLKLRTLRPRGPHHMGGKIQKKQVTHSRNSGRGHGRGLTSKYFFYFFENSGSCLEAYRSDGRWRKLLLDGAPDLLAKI